MLQIPVDIAGPFSVDELDRLTVQLRRELSEEGIDAVPASAGGSAPTGTKGAEAITLGALAVAVLPAVLPKLIDLLQSWVLRGKDRKLRIKTGDIELELPIDGMASADVAALLNRALSKPAQTAAP